MELKFEFLSMNRSLLGLSYMKGEAVREDNNQKVIFHEFGIGFLFLNILVSVIGKGEN